MAQGRSGHLRGATHPWPRWLFSRLSARAFPVSDWAKQVSFLKFKKNWITKPGLEDIEAGRDELIATYASFQIFLGKENITAHKVGRTKVETRLSIPLYYLAEWLAENWWVLLFEPRKDEESDDPDFFKRHSILSAQHGFPLPALSLVPLGRSIHLDCIPRKAPYADVSFNVNAFGDESREVVEAILSEFLRDADDQLRAFGITDTNFQTSWKVIQELEPEERAYCELAGSLGISPSEINDNLSESLERIASVLGPGAIRDFCLATTPEQLSNSVALAEELVDKVARAVSSNLSALGRVDLPSDNLNAPSWRRGMQAARNLRDKLGIDPKDNEGATKIFHALELDTRQTVLSRTNSQLMLSGGIDRGDDTAKIALFQEGELNRRFAAGRAAYLAWVSGVNSRRLMTNAVTRDQQASRQFAAEILVPQSYLKQVSGKTGVLGYERLREMASSRGAMPDVASKQAYNAGLTVAQI